MSSDTTWRVFLATANAIVAALNLLAYSKSKEARDLFATIAWMGSTTFWISSIH